MAKSSWERKFEKNVKKQAREAKQQAHIEARQNQAASIVNGQPMIGNIRLLDKTAEELVAILAEGYNREDYIVTDKEVTIPIYLKNSLSLEFDKLKQYGMISNYCYNVTGDWNVNILPRLLTYFEDKGCASVQSSSNTNNFFGDVTGIQIQQGTVNSTQNQTINQGLDYESIKKLVEQIRKYDILLDSEFGDKAS